MTIGELKRQIAELDNRLEIEIITPYDDLADGSFNLQMVEVKTDPDTARDYARLVCVDDGE